MWIPSTLSFVVPDVVFHNNEDHAPLDYKNDRQLKQYRIISHPSSKAFELFFLLLRNKSFRISIDIVCSISHSLVA